MGVRLSKAMTAKVLAMASGEQPKAKPKKLCASPVQPAPVKWSFMMTVPTTVRSEANRRDHWAVKLRRKKEQWAALDVAILGSPFLFVEVNLPVRVTWTHIGRRMDSHENLPAAFKGLTDRLAEMLQVDDGDPRITWQYEQRAGKPGVEVRIEGGG